MGNKGPVRYRQYTDEFKVEAVRLAESVGVAAAAKRLGVPDGSLRNWINRGRAGKLESADACRAGEDDRWRKWRPRTVRLRRELESTQARFGNRKKSGGVFREGVAVKYVWIEENRDQYSVARMCRQLGVSRTRILPVEKARAQ